jgi:hypothetical protein
MGTWRIFERVQFSKLRQERHKPDVAPAGAGNNSREFFDIYAAPPALTVMPANSR